MSRVFIHSWHGDFARTQIDVEIGDAGGLHRQRPACLRLFACGCGTAGLQRIHRRLWMRLVPSFRLYRCRRCGAAVFTRQLRRHAYPLV